MAKRSFGIKKRSVWFIATLLFMLAAVSVLSGGGRRQNAKPVSKTAIRAQDRLVSIKPLPEAEGTMCEFPAEVTQTAALFEQAPKATAAAPQTIRRTTDADRAPVRILRDTFPGYSAVAVDNNSDEVYLQDENLFGLKVFNRTDNTPPTARLTEPKRVIGGLLTKLEFNCGLYVDPKTGDVYSVANDTVNTTVIFPRGAKGNVKPGRELETPHGSYAIAVDEDKQEMFLTVEHENSVVVYRKSAAGKEKPLRQVLGDHTGLEDPHGIALDPKDKLMFIVNHGNVAFRAAPGTEGDPAPGGTRAFARGSGKFHPPSITVYPIDANGDVAPLRTITGPATQLNWPAAMYMDAERGDVYVANDMGESILVFRATDNGNVAPSRVIKGPKTGLKNPTGVFVDTKHNEVWASNMGNHSATVYALNANGDVAPLRTIRSAAQGSVALSIGNPGAVTYDTKREEILVPN